jgi:hypothetical protein
VQGSTGCSRAGLDRLQPWVDRYPRSTHRSGDRFVTTPTSTTPASRRAPTGVRRRLATIRLPEATGLFLTAGVLAAMSLGLPWEAASDGSSLAIPRSSWADTPASSWADTPASSWADTPTSAEVRTPSPEVRTPSPGGDPVREDAGGGENAPRALLGAQHPVRVLGLVAALLLVTARRRDRLGRARAAVAVAVGATALPLGLDSGLTSGRVVYAAALVLAALGAGASRRPERAVRARALRG